jgi:hypothetical protein
MFNLTINSTNVANSLNNMYQYQFKNGAFEVPANAEMMITSFQIPYSWYNITTRYNNNSFKIHWPTSTVNSITLTNGGSGYTSVPTVAFTPTNTTVASVTVTAGGSGFTSVPTVAFSAPNTVVSATVTVGGSGYTSVPTVTFSGGAGSGAAATAVLTGGIVTSIIVTAVGTGYTSVPTIAFTGGGGTLAAATAVLGTTATATVVLTGTVVTSLIVTAVGSGYTSTPTITFTGGGGTGATATAVLGVTATATAVLTGTTVTSLILNGGGTGYTVSPTITFSGGGGGTGAAATANAYIPYTLTMDDGFYTVNALNARIQQFCITNNMYLTDGSGNNVYYLSVSPNSTAYANQVITKLIPTSGTGYTVPSGFAGYSLVTKRPPYIEILSNNFGKYLGFTTGIYGKDQIADYNVLSNIIPTATTVNSLLVKCSLVSNGCSNQSDILDAFAIGGSTGGTFGGNLNYTNTIEKFVRIAEGRYNNFIVTITDQNNNDITILDNNLLINFLIRVK